MKSREREKATVLRGLGGGSHGLTELLTECVHTDLLVLIDAQKLHSLTRNICPDFVL